MVFGAAIAVVPHEEAQHYGKRALLQLHPIPYHRWVSASTPARSARHASSVVASRRAGSGARGVARVGVTQHMRPDSGGILAR